MWWEWSSDRWSWWCWCDWERLCIRCRCDLSWLVTQQCLTCKRRVLGRVSWWCLQLSRAAHVCVLWSLVVPPFQEARNCLSHELRCRSFRAVLTLFSVWCAVGGVSPFLDCVRWSHHIPTPHVSVRFGCLHVPGTVCRIGSSSSRCVPLTRSVSHTSSTRS